MLYFFKLLVFLIGTDQEIFLKWFGVQTVDEMKTNSLTSQEMVELVVERLVERAQDGLTLSDIENIIFFILFIRFLVLAIRYNLLTSFCITAIGLLAGYLWYRHLIDLISTYRVQLIKLPYFNKLGTDGIQLRRIARSAALNKLQLGENVQWYNPAELIYYAFRNGIIDFHEETGLSYYIDPISMAISNLSDSAKSNIVPIYYKIYNSFIPLFFKETQKIWLQVSGIAAYAIITRVGKRFCPYLIRWHWTFLLLLGFVEQILLYLVFRISYFQQNILIPQLELTNPLDQNLLSQVQLLNLLMAFIIFCHFGLIFFGLFHAILGQYFYFPFLVETTELHTGPRPKKSIYSGGYTAWQDEKGKKTQRVLPKFWYGFFGSGSNSTLLLDFLEFLKAVFHFLEKKVVKLFKKIEDLYS